MEKKRLASLHELERSHSTKENAEKDKPARTASKEDKDTASPAKLSYAEQREREKTVRRARKKVEDAEALVATREAELAEIERRIAAGEVQPEIFTAHENANKELENAMSIWELAQMEFDDLTQRYGCQ